LEEYSYLGLGTIVQQNRPQPGTKLTYISQSSGTGAAGDQYTGLDRFGRVIDQNWYKSTAIDEYKYGYDADSNVLWKENMVSSTNSELYGDQSGHFYDGLNRLQHFQRGSLSSGHDSIQGSAGHSQDWTLDQTGNARIIKTDGTDQDRDVNRQNEITSIEGLTTPGYDSDGNTTLDETNHALTYDAWNRLMTYGGSSETFSYDAMGRRVTSLISSTTRHLYYSARWQVVEERLNSSSAADTQHVWGLGYVDAMVLRDRDTDSNGTLDHRQYAQQDANYNVTSITDISGNVKERHQYDPYGVVKILNGASDADSGVSDWSADANDTSDWGWVHFHQGGRYDSTTKLYSFRHRDYSPTLQRWMQEDPAGYVDGLNLYEYTRNNPTRFTDSQGLALDDPKFWKDNNDCCDVEVRLACRQVNEPIAKVGGGTHCWLEVVRNGKTVFTLSGSNKGGKTVYKPDYDFNEKYEQRDFNIAALAPQDACGFLECAVKKAREISGQYNYRNVPFFSDNSNTFIMRIMYACGATGSFPLGAWGASDVTWFDLIGITNGGASPG
jgi:RHS repeat-associated protein